MPEKVKIPWKWEVLDKWNSRVAVIGGWLVHTGDASGESMAFVPDPEHKWEPVLPEEKK